MTQQPIDPSASSANPYQTPAAQPAYDAQQAAYGAQQAAYGAQQAAYGAQQAYTPQAAYGVPSYAAAPAAGNDIADEAKGFFGKLFDLSLKTYITPSIVRVLYVITMVISVIVWIILIISGFHVNVGVGILAIVLGWIVGLLVLVLFRLSFEVSLAMIRTAENTARIK